MQIHFVGKGVGRGGRVGGSVEDVKFGNPTSTEARHFSNNFRNYLEKNRKSQ